MFHFLCLIFPLIALCVLDRVSAAAQVTGVSVASNLTIGSGTSFPVSIVLARDNSTPATMQVDFTLVDPSGNDYVSLGTEPITTSGKHTFNLITFKILYGAATGWKVRAKERTQTAAVFSSNSFSVFQSPARGQFVAAKVGGTDKLIVASSSTATADGSITTAQAVNFQARAMNIGEANADGFSVRIVLDGSTLGNDSLTGLLGNQSKVVAYQISNVTAGQHTLTLNLLNSTGSVVDTTSQVFTVTSLVDLQPYQPPEWGDKVVISKNLNNFVGASTFTNADSLYLNIGYANLGISPSGGFKIALFVDGIQIGGDRGVSALLANTYSTLLNIPIGSLTEGTHRIEVGVDQLNDVLESNEGNNSFSKTITITAPKIAVEQPPGVPLADGTSTIAFPSTVILSQASLSFLVKNLGTSNLEISSNSIIFTGSHVGDFSVISLSGSTVPAGGNVIMVVRFTPAAVGNRTATIHIPSNVIGEANPFSFNLSGVGVSNLQAWRQAFFPGSTATSGDGANLATPRNDGISNLLKFATGMNPTSQGVNPGTLTISSDRTEMIFNYNRSKAATSDGIIFSVEWSEDFAATGWSSVGVVTAVVDGAQTQQVTARIPVGISVSRFVRLRVTTP